VHIADPPVAEQLFRDALLVTIAHANLFHQRTIIAVSFQSQKPSTIFFRDNIAFGMARAVPCMDINGARKWWLAQFSERVVRKQQEIFFIFSDQPQTMPAGRTSCSHFAMRWETIDGGFPVFRTSLATSLAIATTRKEFMFHLAVNFREVNFLTARHTILSAIFRQTIIATTTARAVPAHNRAAQRLLR
jgi:hypothetical protein